MISPEKSYPGDRPSILLDSQGFWINWDMKYYEVSDPLFDLFHYKIYNPPIVHFQKKQRQGQALGGVLIKTGELELKGFTSPFHIHLYDAFLIGKPRVLLVNFSSSNFRVLTLALSCYVFDLPSRMQSSPPFEDLIFLGFRIGNTNKKILIFPLLLVGSNVYSRPLEHTPRNRKIQIWKDSLQVVKGQGVCSKGSVGFFLDWGG